MEIIEKNKITELNTFQVNVLLYKAKNLQQAYEILEKYKAANVLTESSIKNVVSKCETVDKAKEIIAKYGKNINFSPKFINFVKEKF
jgi:hypothetical protein